MMLHRYLPYALAIVAMASSAPAQTEVNHDVLAAARAFDEAQQTGDRAALERMLSPDFLFVRASGRIGDKSEFVAGFTAPGHTLEPFRIVDPLFVRVSADVAIVGGEAWLKGVDAGRPILQHFRYSDTFAKRDGRWVVVYAQVTALPADSREGHESLR